MPKKNYQRLSGVWNPNISSINRDEFEIKFSGINKRGTSVQITARLSKHCMVAMVKSMREIAENDASVAVKFLERMKEAMQ